jgi:hypothetical protein
MSKIFNVHSQTTEENYEQNDPMLSVQFYHYRNTDFYWQISTGIRGGLNKIVLIWSSFGRVGRRFIAGTVKLLSKVTYSPSRRPAGGPLTNLPSTLRTAPGLYKKIIHS